MRYDNVSNDKYLAGYLDIQQGKGRPKIIDDMIDARREQENMFLQNAILHAADRIEKVWREEASREYILKMSWHIMALEDMLERNGIDYKHESLMTDMEGTEITGALNEEMASHMTQQIADVQKRECDRFDKSQEALDRLSQLDEELGLQ